MARRGSVSTVLLRPLVAALTAIPGGPDALYAATDLTAEMLADPEARVSPAQFCVAWAEAIRLTRDPALALSITRSTPPGSFGIVEYVCRCAPDLRRALTEWCRYLRILDDAVEVALVDLGAGGAHAAALRVTRESEAPAPASHELCFALVLDRARALLERDARPLEVSFAHRADSAHAARHRAFFAAPVRFGAAQTEIVFGQDLLDAPLTSADPKLLEILLPAAAARAERPTPDALLTDQVRRVLEKARLQDETDVDTIAKKLGMTARSLQRRLRDEGVSFQAVRDETRRSLAEGYLRQGMSFSEISFLLGFSEPSAFFRAFKRWTGHTPVERRAHLLLEASAI